MKVLGKTGSERNFQGELITSAFAPACAVYNASDHGFHGIFRMTLGQCQPQFLDGPALDLTDAFL